MGSSAVAAWIAQAAFWTLLLVGLFSEEIGRRLAALFVILWLAGMWGLPYLPHGDLLFPSYVAVLAIALVLIIFKGDVPLR